MANVGDYVDINVGYEDVKVESTSYTTTAWRVLSKDTTAETVKLISTGHPLTFLVPTGPNAQQSLVELKTIEKGPITLQTASYVIGYYANGFSTTNIAGLFSSNTAVFDGITLPVRADFTGIEEDNNVRKTGEDYWLGETDGSEYGMWAVSDKGKFLDRNDYKWAILPIVLLKSGVLVKDGNGTAASSYRLNGITY